MAPTPVDRFWNTDLEEVEGSFLQGRKVTSLPAHLDERVPPSEIILPIVDVDAEVERVLGKRKVTQPWWKRLFG